VGQLTGKAWKPKGGLLRDGRFIDLLSSQHRAGCYSQECEDLDEEEDEPLVDEREVLDRLLTRIPPPLEVVVRSMLIGEQQSALARRLGFAQSTVSVWQNHACVDVLRRVASLGVDLTPAEVFDHVHKVVPSAVTTRPRMPMAVMEYWRWHSTAKVARYSGFRQTTVWGLLFDKTGFVNVAPKGEPVAGALLVMRKWGGFNGLR